MTLAAPGFSFGRFNEKKCISNKRGFSLQLFGDGRVFMTFDLSEYEAVTETICLFWKEYADIHAANRAFSPRVRNLEKVNRAFMQSLFARGLVELSCYIERKGQGRRFFFFYQRKKLFYREESKIGEIQVFAKLRKPADFVAFARRIPAK